ncbi:MAG: NAD(P)/FAD-dependent oxidoreductase [Nitriliruptoraceae bacterium]
MDVLVVGAGVAGSLAARQLVDRGHRVTLLDKGLAPGGRLATRRVGSATFDLGAQFLTARSERFTSLVAGWEAAGVVRPWFRGSPDLGADPDADGHPRWRGHPTMRTLATHLIAGLDVSLGTVVTRVAVRDGGWEVEAATRRPGTPSRPDAVEEHAPRHRLRADALVLTAPVPQSLALLQAGQVPLPDDEVARLRRLTYDPCLTLLAVPRGPVSLPKRGAVRIEDGTLAWVGDQRASGASATPAVTVHAAAAFSRDHLDASDEVVGRRLVRAAAGVLHAELDPVHLHRWRYAAPTAQSGAPSHLLRLDGAPLALAGDAFVGGRVEGAARSGLDAGERLAATADGASGP